MASLDRVCGLKEEVSLEEVGQNATQVFQPLEGGWSSPRITGDLLTTEISCLEEMAALEGEFHGIMSPP